mgnify:FL=1
METKSNNAELIKILQYKGKIAEIFIGLTTSRLIVLLFDYLLYPFVVHHFGILQGGGVMTLLSFIFCVAAVKFYDWSKRDWFGIETIKEVKTYKGTRKIGRFTSWIMKKGVPVVFLFLSIKFDPFITTAYMRHGKYNGMSKRDWTIFMGSLLISNAYWDHRLLHGYHAL